MGPIGFFGFSGKEGREEEEESGEEEDQEGDEVEGIETLFRGGVEMDVFDGEVFGGDDREVEEGNDV